MKYTTMAAMLMAVLFLLTVAVPEARADLNQTFYCTSASDTSCFDTAPLSGQYWTVETNIALTTTSSTFDFTLSVTAHSNTGAGYLQDFSAQYFFGGSQLTSLTYLQANGWTDLEASKAGNSGSCNGNTPGSLCGSATGSSPVALGTTAKVWEVTGGYTGTFLSDDTWHLQLAASNNSNGTGGNAFAISKDITSHGAPDGGTTLVLMGSALVALETLRRRFIA